MAIEFDNCLHPLYSSHPLKPLENAMQLLRSASAALLDKNAASGTTDASAKVLDDPASGTTGTPLVLASVGFFCALLMQSGSRVI